jgi:hypothetical protein
MSLVRILQRGSSDFSATHIKVISTIWKEILIVCNINGIWAVAIMLDCIQMSTNVGIFIFANQTTRRFAATPRWCDYDTGRAPTLQTFFSPHTDDAQLKFRITWFDSNPGLQAKVMSDPKAESHTILQQRSVVSSFIFSIANERSQVALFKRSDKVNTYQYVFSFSPVLHS